MINVVGLDLAIRGGIGVCGDDTTAETITTKLEGDDRLEDLEQRVLASCAEADVVVLEDYVTGVYASSVTGMVHGVVRLGLKRAGIPYAVMSPAGVKKLATGKGNTKKTALAVALMKRAGLELADDNQVDAWWLRLAGVLHYEPDAVTLQLPQVHLDALKAVKWPEVTVPQFASGGVILGGGPTDDRIPAMLSLAGCQPFNYADGARYSGVCATPGCGHTDTAHATPGGSCIGNRNLCVCLGWTHATVVAS